MIRQGLRNLFANKLRLVLTSLAIVLGVGFVSGAFVLSDTINKSFDDLFTTVNAGVAVSVRSESVVSDDNREPISASIVEKVRGVAGVKAATGDIFNISTQLIGKDGKPIGGNGPPTIGSAWSGVPELSPYDLRSGEAPRGPSQVVIDAGTAKKEKFAVGDRVKIITPIGPREFTISGIVGYGDQDSLLGATVALFDQVTAEKVLDTKGLYAAISAASESGVSQADLAERVQNVLPSGVEAVTGETATKEQNDQVKAFVDIFRNILLVFAGVALFVGAFIIFNVFSITVAQRTRQLGLLRAIGASGSQVVRSVMVEALVIAALASVVGVAFGVAVAQGLKVLFSAFGIDLPATSLVVTPRTIIVGMVVGVVITLLAAIRPALRAARISPLAALREAAAPVEDTSFRRRAISVAVAVAGVALVFTGLFADFGNPFLILGLGSLLLFIGTAMIAEQIARPLARLLGAPMQAVGGLSARLGRENAMRSPGRTAQTAAALMIGVALVTGATIFGSSLKSTLSSTLDDRLNADLVVVPSVNQEAGFSTDAARRLDSLSQLGVVSAWRGGQFKSRGATQTLNAVDPESLAEVYDADVVTGSVAALNEPDTVLVGADYAKDKKLSIGSEVPATFNRTGEQRLKVIGTYDDTSFGDFFVSTATFERNYTSQDDSLILLKAARGTDTAAAQEAARITLATTYPNLKIQTKKEFNDDIAGQIDQLLALIYLLLGLAILIAVLGIIITLALSVFERTREIGLMRAVGMGRRMSRAMIRWESIIVALIGGLLGLALGLFLGVALSSRFPETAKLTIPWVTLVIFVVLAGLAGVLAAIFPARRAAKLDVLHAIQSE